MTFATSQIQIKSNIIRAMIAPWFLDEPFESMEEFEKFIRMLDEAMAKKIYKVLIGVHESNIASWKTVEKCGGVLENTVVEEGDEEPIRRYWIDNLN